MKAVVFEGESTVRVEEKQQPVVAGPKDALLRVTTSAICGSDLHMYEGRTTLQPGQIVGHEIMGVLEEVGSAVTGFKPGDRVVLPFNIACGYCYNCHRGYTNMCLTMNEHKAHAAYGYVGMGPYRGGQAEYVLVPNADFNCLKLPGKPFDEWEDDFILLADVFPTGFYGAELAHVSAGKSVAVFGAGPVGLMAALSSLIRGAADVYVIDFIAERLAKARELGATPIDIRDGDPVDQVMRMRRESGALRQRLHPGEEKLAGVDCVIDAVGYQARNDKEYAQEKATQVLQNMVRLVNPAGHIGIVGVYLAPDPKAGSEQARQGIFSMPMADLFDKSVTLGMGQCPVKRYNEYLRDLIIAGRVKPSKIVSHRISIDKAPEAYDKFDRRIEGYTKVVIKFGPPKAA
ncbi:MAG: glutathione-independent formaldehyde dehydrogenase [Gammaproteobacteria bacterium]|nr:glutathione-independent formaldehyde dehydrogenase [Gammaproteobacteria bacterium]